jgi:hypothetical protein
MPPKTAADLRNSTIAKRNERIASIRLTHTKTNAAYVAAIDAWITDIVTIQAGATSSKLDTKLTAAAESGRSIYLVESPVFSNPGQKDGILPPGKYEHNGRSLFYEDSFRAFLKSLNNPITRLAAAVGAGITVTEIEPTMISSTMPVLPQNVVFRYRFSW